MNIKNDIIDRIPAVSRRDFIRTSTITTMGLALSGGFTHAGAFVPDSNEGPETGLLFWQVHLAVWPLVSGQKKLHWRRRAKLYLLNGEKEGLLL